MSKAEISSGMVKNSCSASSPLGAPAQQGDVVDDGAGEVAHAHQVLIGGVAVALGHLADDLPPSPVSGSVSLASIMTLAQWT